MWLRGTSKKREKLPEDEGSTKGNKAARWEERRMKMTLFEHLPDAAIPETNTDLDFSGI